MTASFPGSVKNFTDLVDGVDEMEAANVNDAYAEIEAIESELAAELPRGGYANTETLADTLALADTDPALQYLDPGGAARDVTLPAEGDANHLFVIVNTADAAETITVKDDGANTIGTVAQGEVKIFVSNSVAWKVVSGGGSTLSKATAADVASGTEDDKYITPAGYMNSNLLSSGWNIAPGTWTYSSADDPVFVASVNSDMTGIVCAGQRVKLTQTTVKYFIVVAVGSYSGGSTAITLYGGTDYDLDSAAISGVYISSAKAPFGFPLSPEKWTVTKTDTTQRSQSTPTKDTWYNLGSVNISIPIGVWNISYRVMLYVVDGSSSAVNIESTLSTANNSESDASLTNRLQMNTPSGNVGILLNVFAEKILTVSSKTSYYINTRTTLENIDNIYNRNEISTLTIKAVSLYL